MCCIESTQLCLELRVGVPSSLMGRVTPTGYPAMKIHALLTQAGLAFDVALAVI